MRTIGIALTAITLLSTIGANNQVSPSPLAAESAEADGLAVSIRADSPESSGALRLHVALENMGQEDILLNLGTMLGNGRIQRPEAIRLLLVDGTGDRRELHYADPDVPGVAGRIDDYAVPLRAGSSYSVALELRDFWCPTTKEHAFVLPPGAYKIHAQFTGAVAQHDGGITSLPFWTGTLESAATVVKIDGRK